MIVFLCALVLFMGCEELPSDGEVNMELNPGIDTIEINTDFVDAGVEATVDGRNLSVNVVDGEVDTSTLGTYTITYEATYESKAYRLERHVYVIDETPPVLELNPGVDTVFVGDDWTDAGVSVSDNSLEALDYTVTGDVDTLVAGTYEIIYSATDSSDNEGQVSRFVVVMDQE